MDEGFKIIIPVHNIGIEKAINVSVKLFKLNTTDKQIIAEKFIDQIDAPLDLNAKIETAEFIIKQTIGKKQNLKIIVDAENNIPEINETNNFLSLDIN